MSKEVIETFFLDWGGSFGIGAVLGLVGRQEIAAARSAVQTRAFRWGVAYFEFAFVTIALAFYVARPDWMWMYWVDAHALPIAVVVLAFAMYQLAFVAGFCLAPAMEGWKRGAGITLAVVTGTLITAAEIAARARLLHFGTLAEFRAGTAGRALDSPAGWTLLVTGLASVLIFAIVARQIWRHAAERG